MIPDLKIVRAQRFCHYLILFLLISELVPSSAGITSLTSASATSVASSFTPSLNINRTVVPTPYVKEFGVPTPSAGLTGITVDRFGNVWFMEDNASKIGVFFAGNDSFKEYPFSAPAQVSQGTQQSANLSTIALVALSQIAYDSNTGKIWFTWAASNSIGELDPGTGQTKFYPVPTKGAGPFGILINSSTDKVWFTEILGNKIGRLDPSSGVIQEFDTPTSFSGPGMMAFDSQGRIWFTETYGRKIGVLDPTTAQPGTAKGVQEYSPPYALFSPLGIAYSNGAVWFTDHGANSFSAFIPQNSTWKQFWVNPPTGVSFGGVPIVQSLPAQILIAEDGSVWLAEHQGNNMARFDPATGVLTEYEVPTRPLTETLWLALDENGNVWFTEYETGKIGVVNASKTVPINVSTSNSTIFLHDGGLSTIKVSVSSANSSTALGSYNYTLSGLSTFGLENMTYSFNPSEYATPNQQTTASTNLTISASDNLERGNYSIIIGASNNELTTSRLIALVVSSSPSPSVSSQLYPFSFVIAAIVIALSLLFVFRRKKRSQTNGQQIGQ